MALTSWCSQSGIQIDSRIEIRAKESSTSVYARDSYIPQGETLVRIPRNAVLSPRNCSIAKDLKSAPYGRESQLSLALALYVELDRGSSSRWYGYLQSMPPIVDIPLFWIESPSEDTKAALRWLKGTAVEQLLLATENGRTIMDELHSYYEETVKPIYSSYLSKSPTFERFCYAFSLVSSRAFLVDAYHGLSMVPIADAFNHVQDNHVHLESEYDVCPECGSLQECAHDGDNRPAPESTSPSEEYYEMVSNAPILPSSEIYNTYGENLSNADLLFRYGFMLDENDNDSVTFSENDLTESFSSPNEIKQRTQLSPEGLDPSQMVSMTDRAGWFIDAEGSVSHHMWLDIVLRHCVKELGAQCDADALIEQVIQAQLDYERLTSEEEGSLELDVSPIIQKILVGTATSIIILCQERKQKLGESGSVSDALDKLGLEMTRTRLAILQVMAERSILETCEASWGAILAIIVQCEGDES